MIGRSVNLTLCVAALCGGAFAFADEPVFVPLNARLCRMSLQDGTKFVFVRDLEDRLLMRSRGPWMAGERPERRMVNVFTDPKFKGESKEYCFVDGHLRYMTAGKKDYAFKPSDWAAPTNTVESLWPKTTMTAEEKRESDIWRGGGRLRLFSRNPNRTALIFAEALMLALGCMLFASGWCFRIVGLACSAALFIPLLMTQSRGGLLGAFAGVGLLSFFRFRHRFNLHHLISLALGALALLAVCHFAGFGQRFSEAKDGDQSTMSRLVMWREVPRMVAAAPLGWGLWKSGNAYNSWFERQENMHMTGDLFNDHLSRFAEGGFVFGGLYVFAWVFVLLWCGRLAWRGESPVPISVCGVYFISCCFNPMNYWLPTFYIPIGVTAWAVAAQIRCRRGEPRAFALPCAALILTGLILLTVAVVAGLAPKQGVPIRVSALGRRVVVGHGEPKVWVADDRYVLCGDYNGFPGKEIREYYQAHPNAEPMGLVERLEDLPKKTDRLVITGRLCRPYLDNPERTQADHVILMSPPFGSRDIPRQFRRDRDLHLLTGEFAARLTGDDRRKANWIHVVRGAETYIPGWLDIVVRKNEGTNQNGTAKEEG